MTPRIITAFSLLGFFVAPLTVLSAQEDQHLHKILAQSSRLNPVAVAYALKAYHWARSHKKVSHPNVLTLIDFDRPSYEKRLWVIDMQHDTVLLNTYTAQGKNSGYVYAKHFSNTPDSNQSSLGVFMTGRPYKGKHGLSERLYGVEPGINNNAYRRDLVVHAAWYVSPSFIRQYHRAGRSYGCFALSPSVNPEFIRLTRGGSVIFAYAKQEQQDQNLI